MRSITQSKLKTYLSYDALNGIFTWNEIPTTGNTRENNRKRNGQYAGKQAGSDHRTKLRTYVSIKIDGRRYLAHRLAWLYTYGEMPLSHIDHINNNPSDNRIANLRKATCSENLQNRTSASSASKSGLLGAYFIAKINKYTSHITIKGKRKHVGIFETKEEAHAAYMAEKAILHPYGEICNSLGEVLDGAR